jgi:hypothetical protein
MNGVVHHALAFNTLLSSQETDAFTINQPIRPGIRGVPFCRAVYVSVFRSYQIHPVSVKPALSAPFTLNPPDPLESRPPCFQGNPSNLLRHPVLVQLDFGGTHASQRRKVIRGAPEVLAISANPLGPVNSMYDVRPRQINGHPAGDV